MTDDTTTNDARNELVEEYGEDLVDGWEDNMGEKVTDTDHASSFRDAYAGHFDSGRDFAMELAADMGHDFDKTWPPVDWEAAWKELDMNDYYMIHDTFEINGTTYNHQSGHVFRNI